MDVQHLEQELQSRFDVYEESVDTNEIWKNISPYVKHKRKYSRRFFWLVFAVLFAIVMFLILFIEGTNKRELIVIRSLDKLGSSVGIKALEVEDITAFDLQFLGKNSSHNYDKFDNCINENVNKNISFNSAGQQEFDLEKEHNITNKEENLFVQLKPIVQVEYLPKLEVELSSQSLRNTNIQPSLTFVNHKKALRRFLRFGIGRYHSDKKLNLLNSSNQELLYLKRENEFLEYGYNLNLDYSLEVKRNVLLHFGLLYSNYQTKTLHKKILSQEIEIVDEFPLTQIYTSNENLIELAESVSIYRTQFAIWDYTNYTHFLDAYIGFEYLIPWKKWSLGMESSILVNTIFVQDGHFYDDNAEIKYVGDFVMPFSPNIMLGSSLQYDITPDYKIRLGMRHILKPRSFSYNNDDIQETVSNVVFQIGVGIKL